MPETSHLPTLMRGVPGSNGHLHAERLVETPAPAQADQPADLPEDLAARLQRAREAERAALARDLHDELGAILTAARLDVAWLAAQPSCQSPHIAARLLALRRVLGEGISLKRRLVEDLHPTVLTHLGFAAAIEQLIASHQERFGGRVRVDVDPTLQLSGDAALALYRVAQESLTNVLNYSEAREVSLSVLRHRDRIELTVTDDGRGFDPDKVAFGHHGLAGQRDRMLAVGGHFEVESTPGAGTRIRAFLPTAQPSRLRTATPRGGLRASAPAHRAARGHRAPPPFHP